jgi:hypothetical protein
MAHYASLRPAGEIPIQADQPAPRGELGALFEGSKQEDGIWTQQPRYTFEGMDFETTN